MSYDLHVYCPRRLSGGELASLIRMTSGLRPVMDGTDRDVMSVSDRLGLRHLFTIDGPFSVEPEDVGGLALEITPSTVLYSFIAIGTLEAATTAAQVVASRLAAATGGVVVDPQLESAPIAVSPAVSPAETPPPKAFLRMSWYRNRDGSPDMAERYLAAAREHFPPAVPTRFGTHEPMQGRFPRDDDGAFGELARQEPLGSIIFSGRGMSGSISDWTDDLRARIQTIRLRVDPSTLSRARMAAIAPFFEEVARRASCDFAAVQLSVSGIPLDVMSRGCWAGMPSEPVWMSWYSSEYAELIRPFLTSGDISESAEGFLHRWSEQPTLSTDLPPLVGRTPWVSPELLATRDTATGDLLQVAARMPQSLRPLDPESPKARAIEARIAANRAKAGLV